MNPHVFVPKYRAIFGVECSVDKGNLRLLLQTLLEIKAGFGIETKQICCNFAFQRLKYIPMSYEDAKAVVEERMSEDAYLEKHQDKGR